MKVCRICKKCNKEFDNEFSFCPFCGEKYISNKITTQQVVNNTPPKIPISETPKLKTCLSCRKNVPQDDKYCQFCGAEFLSFKKQNGNEPQTFNRTTQIQPIAEKEKSDSVKWYNKTSVAAATAIIGIIACFLIGICMGTGNNSENDTINPKYAKAVDTTKELFEERGYLCWTEGYTFDKCTTQARSYLYDHYGEKFQNTCAFVYTKDFVKTYYVYGYTNSGRLFLVTIIHQPEDSPKWKVKDAIVYKNE